MESRESILHILHRLGSVEQMKIRKAIRQYFQKRTAFDEEKPQRIKLAQDRLNGRPRRVLN
jgi:IS30 family transposase